MHLQPSIKSKKLTYDDFGSLDDDLSYELINRELIIYLLGDLMLVKFIMIFVFLALASNLSLQCQLSFSGKIIHLGGNINSEYNDYAPSISPDGKFLLFVTDRAGTLQNLHKMVNSHDIFYAFRDTLSQMSFTNAVSIDTKNDYAGVNTRLNEGAACFSSDMSKIYFTACNRVSGHGDCDIYCADISIKDNKIVIGNIYVLPWGINMNQFDSQPAISPDSRTLYFVSTRMGPNSDGKNRAYDMDVGYCHYDTLKNKWQDKIYNFSTINTKGTDVSPFLTLENNKFFFASNGYSPNYGGLDLYYTFIDSSGQWHKPFNLGKPINTKADEQFISIERSGKYLFFASKRDDIEGAMGGFDIYVLILDKPLN